MSLASRMVVGPLLFYIVWFILLTFPLIVQFNSAFFTDSNDGYQMVWDVWWVRRAITSLHQNPFATRMQYFPLGTSLLLHSLTPFNGLLSIILAKFLTNIQTFNCLVILAFSSSGLTAFWLCWKTTRSYWPSIAGGFGFAFCSYRWAHFNGHLELISSQIMPLFLVGLLCLLARPGIAVAIATAIALLLILLCDHYQFLFCVIVTSIVILWWLFFGKPRDWALRPSVVPLTVFFVTMGLTIGPIVLAMIHEAGHAPMLGTHDPELFSADLLGPWVPDWTWLYSGLTRWSWVRTTSPVEKSVCLGPAVVVAAVCALIGGRKPRRLELGSIALFGIIAITFITLCFGPTWTLRTVPITRLTPYRALVFFIPQLQLSGCPGRMIVMAQLAVSVLAAAGLSRIGSVQSKTRRTVLVILFGTGFVVGSQPHLLLTCPSDVPNWVLAVRDAPGDGAVIDLPYLNQSKDLFYQTIHHRPIAGGFVSRVSANLATETASIADAAARGNDEQLAEMGFAYLVVKASAPAVALPLVYADKSVCVYALPAASRRSLVPALHSSKT